MKLAPLVSRRKDAAFSDEGCRLEPCHTHENPSRGNNANCRESQVLGNSQWGALSSRNRKGPRNLRWPPCAPWRPSEQPEETRWTCSRKRLRGRHTPPTGPVLGARGRVPEASLVWGICFFNILNARGPPQTPHRPLLRPWAGGRWPVPSVSSNDIDHDCYIPFSV